MGRILIEHVDRLNHVNRSLLFFSSAMGFLLLCRLVLHFIRAYRLWLIYTYKGVSWDYPKLHHVYDDYVRILESDGRLPLIMHIKTEQEIRQTIYFDEQQATEQSCLAEFNIELTNILLCINGILLLPLGIPFLYIKDVSAGTAVICLIAIACGGVGSLIVFCVELEGGKGNEVLGLSLIIAHLIEVPCLGAVLDGKQIKQLERLRVRSASKALESSHSGVTKACLAVVLCISAIGVNVVDNTASLTVMAIVIGYAVEATAFYVSASKRLHVVSKTVKRILGLRFQHVDGAVLVAEKGLLLGHFFKRT